MTINNSGAEKTNKDKLFVLNAGPTVRFRAKKFIHTKTMQNTFFNEETFGEPKSLFKAKPTKIQGNTMNKHFGRSQYTKPVFLYMKSLSLYVFYIA